VWAAIAAATAGLLVVLTGCGGSGSSSSVTIVDGSGGAGHGLRGVEPPRPLDKPALGLVGTDGQPFDLRKRTAGKVTLLFFGYTKCPDVCPTTMADIAAALSAVDLGVRSQVAVVFVTTDPQRDSAEALARWLRQFDASFIGVTGTLDRVHEEAARLGVPVEEPARQPDGSFLVLHGAQVTAFTKDGDARVVYLAGTQVPDYIHDLPILTGLGPDA
jgi:protein SCO1/2